MSLGKYLRCRLSLGAYLFIDDMISKDDLGLNLYIVLTTYHIVMVLENQNLVRRKLLADLS